MRCRNIEKGGIVGLVYGILLLILGAAGLYNKANLCSYYIAAFLFILGLLALVFGYHFGREKSS